MQILIIDQCSKSKAHTATDTVLSIDDIKSTSREELVAQTGVPTWPARKLYTGRQQQYINNAVDSLRGQNHTVDRFFISAGFGLVEESTELPAYDVTFAEMDEQAISQQAQVLDLTEDLSHLVSDVDYDIVFFPLGQDYVLGVDFEMVLDALPSQSFGVVFNQESFDDCQNVISLPARTEQARSHNAIVVALKGVYLQNFAAHLAQGATATGLEDIRQYCLNDVTTQTEFDQYS